jgi:hypothetical protein
LPQNENKPVQKKKVGTNNSNNKKNTSSNNKPPRRPKANKPRTDKSISEKPKTEKQKTDKPKTNRPKPDRARTEKQKTEKQKADNKTTDQKKNFKKTPYKKGVNRNKDKKQNKKKSDDFSLLSKPVKTKDWTIEEAERYVTAVKRAFEKIPESEDKKVDLRDIWINSSLPGDLILEVIKENYEMIGIEKENLMLDGEKILLVNEQPKPVTPQKKEEKTLNA